MSVKLLTEHHLEFLSSKGGCTGSFESTLVKMSHWWKSHVAAQIYCTQCFRVPTEIQKHNSMILKIFHDQQCNFHDYLMHRLQPPLLAATTPAECRSCMHFEMKRQLVFWLLVVLSHYFTKFLDFYMIIQVFFKFHDFSMHGTFFSDFPGFP